jgi:hypothetical protein
MENRADAMCEFQKLVDEIETHTRGDLPVAATAIARVEFADGDVATFKLCEACAAEQENLRDPRVSKVTTLRRL